MHAHAVIAVEPAALTVFWPQETQVGFALGSFQKFASHTHAALEVEPGGLVPWPQEAHVPLTRLGVPQ